MATEPPPLFDDSDNEEAAADSNEETAQSANLFDVDLTKEESPAPAAPTEDPLFQPPVEEKEVEKKSEELQPLLAPDLEVVKPKPQEDSLFDDSDTEVHSKVEKKETPATQTDTESSKPTTLTSASEVENEDKKAAPAEEVVCIDWIMNLHFVHGRKKSMMMIHLK